MSQAQNLKTLMRSFLNYCQSPGHDLWRVLWCLWTWPFSNCYTWQRKHFLPLQNFRLQCLRDRPICRSTCLLLACFQASRHQIWTLLKKARRLVLLSKCLYCLMASFRRREFMSLDPRRFPCQGHHYRHLAILPLSTLSETVPSSTDDLSVLQGNWLVLYIPPEQV